MQIFNYPSQSALKKLDSIAGRGVSFSARDVRAVTRILADVKKNGDRAVITYAAKFDSPGLSVEGIRVTDREYREAEKALTPEFARAMKRSAENIRAFHRLQAPRSFVTTERPGTVLGQMVHPVDAAGVYVPGGKGGNTPLVSSVLMGAIPAKIAGVERVVMATPARSDNTVHPYLLAAAIEAGVDEVYKVGSAWAVAALAFGTETIKKVDVIVGPGNIFVTIAKKLVAGIVGIDMIAGPSEVLVIADESADPECVAADLLSQAEHDPLAACILVTTKRSLALAAKKALFRRMELLPRKEIARASIRRNAAAFVVKDLEAAADVANRVAPEHLELLVSDPFALFPKIRHAGAMFLGHFTPEPVGDYTAGPNHVLPTAGTARFSSALGVENFVKRTSLLSYSREAFLDEASDIMLMAETEGLHAHAESVRVRLGK